MSEDYVGLDSYAAEERAWLASIPGMVDGSAEAVRQRVGRLSRQFGRVLARVASQHDISVGDLEALSVLARTGEPMTPGRIGEVLGLTSGTVSVRLGRLARAGMIAAVDPDTDARSRPVRLTDAGADVWGRATVDRTRAESRLLREALTPKELDQLNHLLARVLSRLDDEFGPAPRHDMTRGGAGRRER